MTRPLTRALFAAALATQLAPYDASAFCRSTTCIGDCDRDAEGCKTTGKPLEWKSTCVGFSLQRDGSINIPFEESELVIEDSFFAWSALPCADGGTATMTFSRLDDVACRRAEHVFDRPNANVVIFQDNKWDYAGVENNLAKTTVHFDAETGEIFGADIEINHAFNEYTLTDDPDAVVTDLQAIVTHEVGHFIGLDHSPDFDATMFAGYSEGETHQRTLEPDDVAGACAAYPPGRSGTCDPDPQGGLGDTCAPVDAETRKPTAEGCGVAHRGAGTSAALAFAACVGLAALAGMRRRRAPARGWER